MYFTGYLCGASTCLAMGTLSPHFLLLGNPWVFLVHCVILMPTPGACYGEECHSPTTKALSVERGSEHNLSVIRRVGVGGRGDGHLGVRNTWVWTLLCYRLAVQPLISYLISLSLLFTTPPPATCVLDLRSLRFLSPRTFYGYFLSWLLPILCWNPRKIVLCFLAPSGDEVDTILYFYVCVRARVCVHSTAQSCPTLAAPWTAACLAPLSMEFFRQEYWSKLPFSPSRDLPNPRIEPTSPALAGRFFTTGPLWSSHIFLLLLNEIKHNAHSFLLVEIIIPILDTSIDKLKSKAQNISVICSNILSGAEKGFESRPSACMHAC